MLASSILLPTNNLFKVPSWDRCNKLKAQFLANKINVEYFDPQISIKKKWDLLMNKFSLIIPNDAQKAFNDFQAKRKNASSNNNHVLQLSQLIIYFEYFYFFYLTDDLQFTLSEKDKTKLVESIKESINHTICETGIITRFEDILQSTRKDNNWIVFQLYQQRRNIIQEIAEEYNALNNISSGLSIHTVFHIKTFAQEEQFGIETEEGILDIHIAACNIPQIRVYAKEALEKKRSQYCKNIEFNLAQHVVFEVTQQLKNQKINISNWEDKNLKLTDEQFGRLDEFILNLFTNKDSRLLVNFDEDGYACVLNKKKFSQGIQLLVHEQLIAHNLLVPFELAQEKESIRSSLFLGEKITFAQLLEFKTCINTLNQEQTRKFLEQQQSIIIEYPRLLLDEIINQPKLWATIPLHIKNNIELTDALFKEIEFLLIEAVESDRCENKLKFFDLLWMLIKSNPLYIFELSSKILNDELCALQLVSKNKFIFRYLPEKLRENSLIYEAAMNHNTQSFYFHPSFINELVIDYNELLKRLPDELSQRMHNINEDKKIFDQLPKILSLLSLIESSTISAKQLIHLSQDITPHELLLVIQERKNRDLAVLPFCNEHSLRTFAAIVEEALWNKGFLTVKRQLHKNRLSKQICSNERIEESIINANLWIRAYFHAERIITSPLFLAKQLLQDLINLLKITAPFIISNLIRYAAYDLFMFNILAAVISYLVVNIGIIPLILLHASILIGVARFTSYPYAHLLFPLLLLMGLSALTPTLRFITYLELAYLGFCVSFLLINLGRFIMRQPLNVFNVTLNNAIIATLYLINPIFNWFFTCAHLAYFNFKTFFEDIKLLVFAISSLCTRTYFTLNSLLMAKKTINISNIEEQIIYLQNAEEQSANQKGELLNELWEQIQDDVKETKDGLTYKQALDKKYPINDSSGLSELSFNDVATQPRNNTNYFDMNSKEKRYSFFNIKQRTATEKIIDEYIEQAHEHINTPPLRIALNDTPNNPSCDRERAVFDAGR